MDTFYISNGTIYEWDVAKALSNLDKHGVRFEEATTVFADPFSIDGDATVDHEPRLYVIGYSEKPRLLFVVYAERDALDNRTRIISARLTTNAERKLYENGSER